MNNTAAQLVKQLGDKREITIMSDVVRGLDFEYNQLKQENEGLVRLLTNKIMLDYDYDSVLKKQLSEERLSYIALSESKHILENILTEFENWLESQIKRCEKETNPKQFTEHDIEITTNTMCRFQ